MLTDTSHVLREDYAAVVTVEKGRDSVDFKLVTLCGAGDVVVTQDYGVAAMALGRGARCLNQNGLLYTNGNIEQLLYTRHENGKARRRGHGHGVRTRAMWSITRRKGTAFAKMHNGHRASCASAKALHKN